MKANSRAAGAVLIVMLAWGGPASAAERVAASEQSPVAAVAQFLSLAPEQVQGLVQLLHERQQALGPILHEIARRELRVRELAASGADPAEIGRLVIEIHHLRQQVEVAQAEFLARFASLLNDVQRRRWQQVRLAARLQGVLPAFQALQLL